MADIQLTPEVLLQQSTEMTTLQSEYESLFQQVKGSLENINGSWSPNLASNFSGKITSAQNSFSSILNMFGNGANAAKASALRFGTPSSWLKMIVDGVGGEGTFDSLDKFASISREDMKELFPSSPLKDEEKALTKTVGIGEKVLKASGKSIPGGFLISPAIRTCLEEKNSLDNGGNGMNLKANREAQDWLAQEALSAEQRGDTVAQYGIEGVMIAHQFAYNVANTATNLVGDCVETIGYVPQASSVIYELSGLDKKMPISYKGTKFVENMFTATASTINNWL